MDFSNPQWAYYHYTRPEIDAVPRLEHVREQVIDGIVYFRRPSQLNDPADCRPQLLPPSQAQLLAYGVRVGARRFPGREQRAERTKGRKRALTRLADPMARQQIWNKNAEKWGVLCLSKKRTNDYLWREYAADSQGVCIEYDFEFIIDKALEPWVFLQVKYAEALPAMNILDYHQVNPEKARQFTRLAFETKTRKWAEEEEVRVLYPVGDLSPPKVQVPMHTISAVYLGVNISEEDRATILRWRPAVPVYQAVVGPDGRLTFKPAN